jgi:5-oxoprolinase (ATP-hydrolysing)
LVALRLTARCLPLAELPSTWSWPDPQEAGPSSTDLVLPGGRVQRAPLVARQLLAPGASLRGPAVLTQPDSTLLLASGWGLTALHTGDLLLERG